jgi:membrane protein YdbS with pleckstrin-like domain
MGMISECLLLLCISAGYQTVSRHWLWMQVIGVITTVIVFILIMLIVPESPKYLYMSKRYTESKDILRYIAWVNGSKLAIDTTFLFD